MKRIIRIVAVSFALIMLAGYVVYSQKQQNRTIAPGSKVLSPPETSRMDHSNGVVKSVAPTATNTVYDFSDVIASSSKSISPLIKVKPAATNRAPGSDWIPVSTSKSGRVFSPSTTQNSNSGSLITNQSTSSTSKLPPKLPPSKASP